MEAGGTVACTAFSGKASKNYSLTGPLTLDFSDDPAAAADFNRVALEYELSAPVRCVMKYAAADGKTPLNIAVSGNRDTAVKILRSHPYVETIAIRQDEIAVNFSGDRQDEVLLLQQLIDAEVPVYAFQRTRGNLESIFMQITDHDEGKVVLSNEDD